MSKSPCSFEKKKGGGKKKKKKKFSNGEILSFVDPTDNRQSVSHAVPNFFKEQTPL